MLDRTKNIRKAPVELCRINEHIAVAQVRLVGENVEIGVYPIKEALRIAQEQSLDLVEVSNSSDPPVCKIIDYLKYKYEHKKKQKEAKAKSHKVVVKEIRLTALTDDHDVDFKLKHAIKFLQEKNKVRVYLTFNRNNSKAKIRGEAMLNKFAERLAEYAKVEQAPAVDEKKTGYSVKMLMSLAPKSNKV